jgi:ABC-type sugar transport system ATPase subunit
MIYVTHDQIEALTLADRIAVMKDGRSSSSRLPGDRIPQLGAPLALSPDTERISLFDTETGNRL